MLQEIINSANIGLIVVGPELDIRLWNKWMEQATGIDSETACYQRADKLLPNTFTPSLIARIKNAIDKGFSTSIPQTEDGLCLLSQPVDITVQPLEGRHYVHALRPVREELIDNLCLLQIRTLQASGTAARNQPSETPTEGGEQKAARLNFLATVGHQIRTPVNGVLGVAELLRDTELTAQQRKYVDLLVRSGQSLQAFVNELTDLSYLEAGRVSLEKEVTDLPTLIQDVVGLFAPTGSNKGLQAVVELGPEVPKYVWTDHQKLRQLLTILVSNAFKFTHEGGVRIHADFVGKAEGQQLVVSIKDTGIGIPKNRLGTLFETYRAEGEGGARYYNRTGLGLHLCREIVDLFGGDIEVESAVGQGTKFTLRLPMEEARKVRRTTKNGKQQANDREYGLWRVLIAEDNPVNQELFRNILEKKGHDVTVVSNGQEAVSAVQIQEPFDIILMDIAMPVMDGMEATSLIRSLFGKAGHTPILALTAHALEGDREIFINAGMDGYQSKPVDPDALLEAMARAIASRQSSIQRWPDTKALKRSARPGNGPMSWLRFPKLGRRRENDPVDQ